MSAIYEKIRALQPRRSKFDLSYVKTFDCDMGQLIPVFIKHVVPGDFLKLGAEAAIRAVPALAPYFATVTAEFFSFFVPYRILMGADKELSDGSQDWEIDDHAFEIFLTGGRDGKTVVSLPRWEVGNGNVVNDNNNGENTEHVNVTVKENGKYSLWDYLEFPVDVIPQGAFPLDFSKRAYNLIYDTWFRDENFQDYISVSGNNRVMNACWKKDYFTSCLPFQQRGIAPGLPISGVLPVSFSGSSSFPATKIVFDNPKLYNFLWRSDSGEGVDLVGSAFQRDSSGLESPVLAYSDKSFPNSSRLDSMIGLHIHDSNGAISLNGSSSGFGFSSGNLTGSVDLRDAVKTDITQLRLAVQIQKWLERNARSGYRMNEFLLAHFGVAPRDETLQKPQFIGGTKAPVIVSEVLQTSQTTPGEEGSALGDMGGHTLSASSSRIGNFHVNEFGLVMTLLVVRPRASYQQGIDREWLYNTKYDFYFPEFAHLSEQMVYMAEIFAQNNNLDSNGSPIPLGYQGRYNELRRSTNKSCGGMRDKLAYWHLGRKFATVPQLNEDFMKCVPSKRVFAVQNEPVLICNVNNLCTAYRPLPAYADPSL